ncbi:MAG: hypothetical protein EPO35_07505 [Acidobacteria bacterium]|nr:MAG: hypothetical protein EPO35_07505 [Acidobacteriota bacterium]
MTTHAYPAAGAVAPRIAAYFSRYRSAPDASNIETLVDAAFWASLRREEGVTPKISLAFASPDDTINPLLFASPLPVAPAALAKLAPAVERPGIHLGVSVGADGQLKVWGTTRHLPAHCFVIEVVTSGLLVIKQRSELMGKFVNVAVLEGDQVKFVDERSAQVPDCPGVLQSLLGLDRQIVPKSGADSINVLVQLAASMRGHGRGGALLVTPSGSDDWMQSTVFPALYALDPPFTGLSDLIRRQGDADDLRHAVEGVAGLTAVDGAMVMNDAYDVLAFGVKINRRKGSSTVERISLTEPIEGSAPTIVSPGQLGGTRHLSAAQFVHDQTDAIALVASQDGRFTIFKWSSVEQMVHAHRVESLLL